tara:strand:+ start:2165 stop:2929 length:765 start_codon:yes stop_codon:yes gene_type:complete
MSSLFFLILNIITDKKLDLFQILNTFLQGGIVSLLIPGTGVLFKYFKLKTLNISLAEYSVSQSLWSLNSFISYLSLALLLGFLKIIFSVPPYIIVLILLVFIFITIFLYLIRLNIFNFLKKNIFKIKRINNVISELSLIKKLIILNKFRFILIYFLFIFLSLLQCYTFFLAVSAFGIEIDFLTSSFLYISTSLVTVLAMINFVGFFELIISFSASFIIEDFIDMALIAFGFRIIYIFALISAILICSIFEKLKK